MRDVSNSLHYAVELLSTITLINKGLKTPAPVSLREVSGVNAGKPTMSLNFLEQIAGKLRSAGILKVVRGPGGGYLINKDITTLSIGDLLDANILRRVQAKKDVPNFRVSKALEAVYAENINKFKSTKIVDLTGFGTKKRGSKK